MVRSDAMMPPDGAGSRGAIGSAAIALTALAAFASAARAGDVERLSPVQIYWRAQAAVNRLPAPAYIAFTFENEGYTFMNQHTTIAPRGELLRVLVRASDGFAVVVAFKDMAGGDIPHKMAGVVTAPNGWLIVSNVVRLGDFPLADFGLRYGRESRPSFFESAEPTTKAPALRVIADVVAFEPPPYRIVDLGDTTINDRPVYHLGLDPIRDPAHNLLRQVWIDKTTLLPLRYLVVRTVESPAQNYTYLVTVDSAEIDGRLVNVDADGENRMGRGRWRIFQISFPDSEPEWVFDAAQWPRHNGEQIPNLAASTPAPP
jgi:hypothetical protein